MSPDFILGGNIYRNGEGEKGKILIKTKEREKGKINYKIEA
jgi:hypothetical protein